MPTFTRSRTISAHCKEGITLFNSRATRERTRRVLRAYHPTYTSWMHDTPVRRSIPWSTNLDDALAESRQLRKIVLIDVCKEPCAGCKKLDDITFADPDVIEAILTRFIPVKLDLFQDRTWVRPLNVFWTPTILFADRRGIVLYESLNFLPPAEFLDLLDIGEAMALMRWAEYDRALELLTAVTDRNPDSPWAPEAIYRRGLITYLKDNDNDAMYDIWRELQERFPDSIWTLRIP